MDETAVALRFSPVGKSAARAYARERGAAAARRRMRDVRRREAIVLRGIYVRLLEDLWAPVGGRAIENNIITRAGR